MCAKHYNCKGGFNCRTFSVFFYPTEQQLRSNTVMLKMAPVTEVIVLM